MTHIAPEGSRGLVVRVDRPGSLTTEPSAEAESARADAARENYAADDCDVEETDEDVARKRKRADVLAREMVRLTGHLSAAEAHFLEMLAEFDREGLWELLGCHCAAQWLTWQCGLEEGAARERVRVARALEKLPKIRAAFRRGQISYSKVREMTRIAIPEMEEALLNIARHGTAAHVQRLVRKYRRVGRLEAAAEAAEQNRRRYVRYSHDDDGMLVIEARLPVEIGEIVVKAIDAAVEVLYRDGACKKREGDEATAESCEADGQDRVARADAETDVDAMTAGVIETESNVPAGTFGVPAGTSASQVRQLDGEQSSDAPSSDVSASDDASPSEPLNPEAVWEPHEMPGGEAVIEEFEGESWPESLGARRADALRLLAESFLASGAKHVDTSAERYQVVLHLDHALAAGNPGKPLEPSEALHRRCELEAGQALAIETARRLACDAALVGVVDGEDGEPLSVGRKTRAIPPAIDRALRARDGGCRFPGCGRARFTHAHHIVHWIDGGETKLTNLITLCTFHHGLVHEGGFSVERTAEGRMVFFAPNGQRLPETGQLDRETIDELIAAAERGHVTLEDLNRERGLKIDARTAQCLWAGERMDYHVAVGGLIWTHERALEDVRDGPAH